MTRGDRAARSAYNCPVALVLLHGLATTGVIWTWLRPYLPAGLEIVALDVPGFGDAAPAGRGFVLDDVADRVAEAIGDHTGAPVDLVGHSMGGAVALVLADRHPELVRGLVLAAPAGLRALPPALCRIAGPVAAAGIDARRAAAPLARLGLARRLLLTGGVADPRRISGEQARTMFTASRGATRVSAALSAVAGADLRPALTRLDAPPGLIWGAADRVVPPGVARDVLVRRPDARVRLIPGTGHIAMVERPERFAAALEELLPWGA
ncbi:alpha/beta fold hydrolase [Paraconexibacter antarcticus]|uniref:Alpha/beta fold hydrolase n=1 Tax=Paraconexibacter antarcticus TaxID=2949664 RepID=A0ABY5DNU1_9ACTN|nr:alpha/beta fold hydrolase [Paraconexibacter antarcticus]UTI63693.1 alpha/beta fold hydrolase [Paraconexibacter antarcticus]